MTVEETYAYLRAIARKLLYALTFCLALLRSTPAPAPNASTPSIVVGSGTNVNK